MSTSLGKQKILFGTNFPMLTWKHCLADVKDLGLTDEVERLFLGENAIRIFDLNQK